MTSDIQNKLLAYAPEPPAGVWDAIANNLDEAGLDLPFSEKLKAFQEAPSDGIWGKIEKTLDSQTSAPVRSIWKPKRIIAALAAAAVIGVLIFSGIGDIDPPDKAPAIETAKQTIRPADSNGSIQKDPSPVEDKRSLAATNVDYSATRTGNQTSAPISRTRRLANLVSSGLTALQQFIPDRAEPKPHIAAATAEQYMVYSDGKGDPVRLPKRLFDFFACVQKDIACKSKMNQIQQQFASASMTSDFTGVMDLVKNLDENQ